MLTFLGLIPILGPIVQAIAGIFTTKVNAEVEHRKIDADVTKTTIQESTKTLALFKDDWGVRLSRDLIMFPGSLWCGLYVWDKIVEHRFPSLVWVVKPLDGPLEVLPMALLAFFFGLAAMNTWKRS